jgi:hypothetical protein
VKRRIGVLVALVLAAIVMIAATAGVAAVNVRIAAPKAELSVANAPDRGAAPELQRDTATTRGAVLGGTPEPTPAPTDTPPPPPAQAAPPPPLPTPAPPTLVGIASNYPGTAGWIGQATVALPGDLGGRYNGRVNGYVTVCADRCARFPVVDWCQCYWGTSDQRIVDLSHPAWAIVSDQPLRIGLIEVQLYFER